MLYLLFLECTLTRATRVISGGMVVMITRNFSNSSYVIDSVRKSKFLLTVFVNCDNCLIACITVRLSTDVRPSSGAGEYQFVLDKNPNMSSVEIPSSEKYAFSSLPRAVAADSLKPSFSEISETITLVVSDVVVQTGTIDRPFAVARYHRRISVASVPGAVAILGVVVAFFSRVSVRFLAVADVCTRLGARLMIYLFNIIVTKV